MSKLAEFRRAERELYWSRCKLMPVCNAKWSSRTS